MRGLGPDGMSLVRPTGVKLLDFIRSGIQFYVLLYLDWYVLGDDASIN